MEIIIVIITIGLIFWFGPQIQKLIDNHILKGIHKAHMITKIEYAIIDQESRRNLIKIVYGEASFEFHQQDEIVKELYKRIEEIKKG